MASKRDRVTELLDAHGETFSHELHIKLESDTPSVLFQWLTASVLYSARINAELATRSARELQKAKLRTARAMAQSAERDRLKALTEGGYTRYRERTASMLVDLSEYLLDRYHGDLRKLREEAGRDPRQERKLLKEVKGLGDVGVDIFLREVQVIWPENAPFADKRALTAARQLKLGADAKALRKLVDSDAELSRLVAALIRADLAGELDDFS